MTPTAKERATMAADPQDAVATYSFRPTGMKSVPNGYYVKHDDHAAAVAALVAERDAYTKRMDALASASEANFLRAEKAEAERDALRADVARLDAECRQHIQQALSNGSAALNAESALADALGLLRRYRSEVPLGHQPHMIAHEVDALLLEDMSDFLSRLASGVFVAASILFIGYMSGAPIVRPDLGNFMPYVCALSFGGLFFMRPWRYEA